MMPSNEFTARRKFTLTRNFRFLANDDDDDDGDGRRLCSWSFAVIKGRKSIVIIAGNPLGLECEKLQESHLPGISESF
jgi:hypothetical protein